MDRDVFKAKRSIIQEWIEQGRCPPASLPACQPASLQWPARPTAFLPWLAAACACLAVSPGLFGPCCTTLRPCKHVGSKL
jgi:hypothetical protein